MDCWSHLTSCDCESNNPSASKPPGTPTKIISEICRARRVVNRRGVDRDHGEPDWLVGAGPNAGVRRIHRRARRTPHGQARAGTFEVARGQAVHLPAASGCGIRRRARAARVTSRCASPRSPPHSAPRLTGSSARSVACPDHCGELPAADAAQCSRVRRFDGNDAGITQRGSRGRAGSLDCAGNCTRSSCVVGHSPLFELRGGRRDDDAVRFHDWRRGAGPRWGSLLVVALAITVVGCSTTKRAATPRSSTSAKIPSSTTATTSTTIAPRDDAGNEPDHAPVNHGHADPSGGDRPARK